MAKKFFICLFSLVLTNEMFAQIPTLFEATSDTGDFVPKFDSTRGGPSKNIRFLQLIRNLPNNEFLVSLPGKTGPPDTIVKNYTETYSNHFTWVGQLKNKPGTFALLTQVGQAIAGQIRTKNKTYGIEYTGRSVYKLTEIRQNLFKPDANLAIRFPSLDVEGTNKVLDECCDTIVIDVLALYTQKASRAAGGDSSMVAQIFQSMSLADIAFRNSRIPMRLNLLLHRMTLYDESAGILMTRQSLQAGRDPGMIYIHNLRDSVGADIVLLVIEDGLSAYSGATFTMQQPSIQFEAMAFAVIERNAAYLNLTVAHEIGHILGCDHQCSEDPREAAFPYAHGYAGSIFRTIMYNINPRDNHPRVEFWSDIKNNYPNNNEIMGSTGDGCQANDAEGILQTIKIVSRFRCRQGCGTARMFNEEPVIDPPKPLPPEPPKKNTRSFPWLLIGAIILALTILFVVFGKKRRG